jgi:hypothetical protein
MQNSKFKIQNAKCKMQNAKCKMQNAKFKTQNSKFKIQNAKMKDHQTGAMGRSRIRPYGFETCPWPCGAGARILSRTHTGGNPFPRPMRRDQYLERVMTNS